MDRLPADLLAHILRRLAPRWLAASRCVRKAWRDAIDDRRILSSDLLPLSMSGILVYTNDAGLPFHFARPTHRPVGDDFGYLDGGDEVRFDITDHCNGLLLIKGGQFVVNPATRQYAELPHPPRNPTPITSPMSYYPCATREYLAFDPATSPHYEVFQVNENVPRGWNGERVEAEWPPSEYALCVFSSRTCRWEVKTFIREGDAAGDLADMPQYSSAGSHYGAYWRGSLYVPQHDFVMRINSSSNTYRVTKLPKCISSPKTDTVGSSSYRLGKSKKGVYCAVVVSRFQLWVWFLDESYGQMEWTLRKEINLEPLLANFPLKYEDAWTMEPT